MTRHLLYDERCVRLLFAKLRDELREMDERRVAELRAMGEKHVAELTRVRAELDAVRAAFDELRSISLARQKAEVELASLYRERAIARARAAERDITQPLN